MKQIKFLNSKALVFFVSVIAIVVAFCATIVVSVNAHATNTEQKNGGTAHFVVLDSLGDTTIENCVTISETTCEFNTGDVFWKDDENGTLILGDEDWEPYKEISVTPHEVTGGSYNGSFDTWYYNSVASLDNAKSIDDITDFDVASDVYFIAKYHNEDSWTVSFSDGYGHNVLSYDVPKVGGTITSLPRLHMLLYRFVGWFYDEELTMAAQIGDTVNSNVTLYSKWEGVDVYADTIDQDGNGIEGAWPNGDYDSIFQGGNYGEYTIVPDYALVNTNALIYSTCWERDADFFRPYLPENLKDQYSFGGWYYYDENGVEKSMIWEGAKSFPFDVEKFYAKWIKNDSLNKVSFDVNQTGWNYKYYYEDDEYEEHFGDLDFDSIPLTMDNNENAKWYVKSDVDEEGNNKAVIYRTQDNFDSSATINQNITYRLEIYPQNQDEENYIFGNFSLSSNDNKIYVNLGQTVQIPSNAGDFKLTANYWEKESKVEFKVESSEKGKVIDVTTGEEIDYRIFPGGTKIVNNFDTLEFITMNNNEDVTVKAVPSDGYEFDTWGEIPDVVASNITITPSFKEVKPEPEPVPEPTPDPTNPESANIDAGSAQTGDSAPLATLAVVAVISVAGVAFASRKCKFN